MPKVVSVIFEGNHKKYYFGSIDGLEVNKKAVVETARGVEIGTIVEGEKEIADEDVVGELKPVIRQATERDLLAYESNKALKPQLYDEIKEILSNHKELEMKLLEVTYTLDRSKLIIYFTSDGRVDFRELVKEIAYKYHTRIELRQVGPRDASRIISGIGECGRVLCCSEFLGDIQNVTIKMAKNQNLSLNPTAISGLCGKLLCCISYEDSQYTERREECKASPSSDADALENEPKDAYEEVSDAELKLLEEDKPAEAKPDNRNNNNNHNRNNNNNFNNRNRNNNNNNRNNNFRNNNNKKADDEEVVTLETNPVETKENTENPNNNNNRNRNNNFKHHNNNNNQRNNNSNGNNQLNNNGGNKDNRNNNNHSNRNNNKNRHNNRNNNNKKPSDEEEVIKIEV